MKRLGATSLVLAFLAILSSPCLAADTATSAKPYTVLEISRFEVNREDLSTKEAERAGRIPEDILDTIQRILVSEFGQSKILPTVRKAGAPGEGDVVLELGGKVVDWMAGSQAKRYWVGMGAGQQKIEVDCVLKDRATGAVLARERILDRKVGGIGGGNEEKGMRDFAEKVAKFMHASLDPRGWKAPEGPASESPAPQPGGGR